MSKAKAKELRLSEKQAAFCKHFTILLNGNQAAIKAGYAKHSARQMASRLLTKANIKKYIEYLRANIEENLNLSRERVANEYAKLAFNDAADVYLDWIELEAFENLSDDVKACIKSIDTKTEQKPLGKEGECDTDVKYVKITFHDKTKALEGLRKMLGYDQPDIVHNINHEGNEPPKIKFK